MRGALVLLACGLLSSPVLAVEEADAPWDLRSQDLDSLILANGNSILGTIEKIREDGAVVFTSVGFTGSIVYVPSQFKSFSYRRTAGQILEQRIGFFLQDVSDPTRPIDLLTTLRWAEEQEDTGLEEGLSACAAQSAVAIPSHIPLVEYALALNSEEDQPERRETVLRAAIAANPNWETGYDYLLDLFLIQGADLKLEQAIQLTLERRRNHHLANLLFAELSMARGQVNLAQEAFRKASAKGDSSALLGFGITSLLLGEWNGTERVAQQLVAAASDEHTDAAFAMLASVRLQKGEFDEAVELFRRASGGTTLSDGPFRILVRHNYALALAQIGLVDEAADVFVRNDHPASQMAAKMLRGEAVGDGLNVSHPDLAAVAAEYAAVKDLEAGNVSSNRLQNLDPDTQGRHRFLSQVHAMLVDRGEARRVRALALTKSQESVHWQLYGHMLAQRWNEAEKLANALAADDGYGLVAKAFILASRSENEAAATLYREQIQPLVQANIGNPVPPINYVAVLAAEFTVADGAYRRYDFAWPNGERLGPGWNSYLEPGSGVLLRVQNGRLVFQGSENAPRPGLARAWCRVRESEFERVILEATYPGVEHNVPAGLEVLDGEREAGVAVAVQPDRSLRWRALKEGRWTSWHSFSPQINLPVDEHLTVLYRSPGRVQILNANKQVTSLGEPFSPGGHLTVSVFAEPQAAGAWSFAADQLDIGQRSK